MTLVGDGGGREIAAAINTSPRPRHHLSRRSETRLFPASSSRLSADKGKRLLLADVCYSASRLISQTSAAIGRYGHEADSSAWVSGAGGSASVRGSEADSSPLRRPTDHRSAEIAYGFDQTTSCQRFRPSKILLRTRDRASDHVATSQLVTERME